MAAALEKNPLISSAYIRYECPHCGSSIWTMLLGLTGARSDAQQSWWAAARNRLSALKITPREDKLFTEIDALPDEELPKRWKKAAHEVRHLGNDGAHAEPVSPGEAAAVLKFTKGVLEQLYILPVELAASVLGRQEKKAP